MLQLCSDPSERIGMVSFYFICILAHSTHLVNWLPSVTPNEYNVSTILVKIRFSGRCQETA